MATKTLPIAVLVLGISAFSSARALYRIDVRGAAPMIAQDQPVTRGSVVIFHRHPDGRLTGVPRELIGGIEPAGASAAATPRASGTGSHIRVSQSRVRSAVLDDTALVSADTSRPARPLEPGEAMVIGPTGSGSPSIAGQMGAPASNAAQVTAARAAVESQVFPGELTTPVGPSNGGSPNMAGGVYGAGAGQPVLNPTLTGTANVANNGATPVLPTGAQSGPSPIGPNGFSTTTTSGPQSGTNPIGPNGFPTTTTNGPQGGTNPIGPNGFPATTTAAPQPGAAQPGQTSTAPRK
ncbi:MAG: hypothetical protein M3167_15920 [Acidobacteriota bacterium]|nr:hypothetical protein [Acidobacteriota bacterium]